MLHKVVLHETHTYRSEYSWHSMLARVRCRWRGRNAVLQHPEEPGTGEGELGSGFGPGFGPEIVLGSGLGLGVGVDWERAIGIWLGPGT